MCIRDSHTAIMDRYDPEHRVGLIIDEWGTWFDVEPGTNPGFLYQQNTMRDALVAGINLNLFNKHCDRVAMANIAQLVNVCLLYTSMDDADGSFKEGIHRLNSNYSYAEIILELQEVPERTGTVDIMIKEGATLLDVANLLEEKGVCKADDFISEVNRINYGYDFEQEIQQNSLKDVYKRQVQLIQSMMDLQKKKLELLWKCSRKSDMKVQSNTPASPLALKGFPGHFWLR